jgi:hypothetical protein
VLAWAADWGVAEDRACTGWRQGGAARRRLCAGKGMETAPTFLLVGHPLGRADINAKLLDRQCVPLTK